MTNQERADARRELARLTNILYNIHLDIGAIIRQVAQVGESLR